MFALYKVCALCRTRNSNVTFKPGRQVTIPIKMSADLGAQKEKSRENVLDTCTRQLVLCGDEVQRVEVLLR